MALRVWLPLNGSLENKGLSGTDFGTSTAFASTGKTGAQSAYSNMQKTITCSELTGVTEFSLAYWLKVDSSIAITNWGDIIGLECTVGSNSAIIRDEFTNAVGLHQIIVGKDTSIGGNTYNYYGAGISTSTAKDVWAHFTIAKNATNTYVYVNGVLTVTLTNSNFESSPQQLTGKIYLGNTSSTAAQFNDLRIYDYCLSAKEVKEIAQGLVLHYKLDNPLIKTSQNLVVVEDPFNGATCFNGATSKYGYGTNTDIYETFGTFQNRKCTKVYMGTNNLDAYPYVYFNAFSAAGSTIHTLSFDYFPSILDTIIPYSYNGAYNWNYKVNGISGTAQNAGSITLPVIIGQWNHIEITATKTDTTNTSRGIGYVRIGSAKHTSNINNYWLFANIQVEEGPYATAYLGVGGAREGYVTDSSGYGHDGIVVGAPIIETNSNDGRYTISTKFNNNTDSITITPFLSSGQTLTEFTTVIWCKTNTLNSTAPNLMSLGENSFWRFRLASASSVWYYIRVGSTQCSSTYSVSGKNLIDNNWHHYAVTFKNGVVTFYVDGIQVGTTNHSSTATYITCANVGSTWHLAGYSASSEKLIGNLTDARIYTTALSTEDIVDLYHTPANIDNLGNLHTFELNEKSGNLLAGSFFGGTITYDATNKYYTITSGTSTSTWGIGPNIGTSPQKIIPWGKAYIFSYEVYTPTAGTWMIDYNNYGIGEELTGNDNDNSRLTTSYSVPANKWTLITHGCANTNATKNPNHVALYDGSTGIGPVMNNQSAAITWHMRNPQWYLVDADASPHVYKNGITQGNALAEGELNNFASFRNQEKRIEATGFIEK